MFFSIDFDAIDAYTDVFSPPSILGVCGIAGHLSVWPLAATSQALTDQPRYLTIT